jgi:hypothetical protein
MLRAASRGIIGLSLILAGLALAWIVCDLLFAAPATLVFEELAIGCAMAAPLVCLLGWAVRWVGCRFEA